MERASVHRDDRFHAQADDDPRETRSAARRDRDPQDGHIFPAIYRETIETTTNDDERIRAVADLISSMSETQVVEVHHRLTGLSLGSAMDPVLP